MKVMELSAVFQPKQRAEKGSREDGNQSKAGPNPNLGPIRRQNRPLFEVPSSLHRWFGGSDRAHQGRQAARAGGDERNAIAGAAGRADAGGILAEFEASGWQERASPATVV
jgi:hypothetical protein